MDQKFTNEQWKALSIESIADGYKFEISNFGRLKTQNKAGQMVLVYPSKIQGYPMINIKLANGKRTTKYIHKLVADLFLPEPDENSQYVIHLDFNKENNHEKNLKWVTRPELSEHLAKNPNQKKGVIRYSKLTETDVIRLKKKIQRGKNPLYKIAKEFGITHTQLNRIRKGENWGHIAID
ncbi:MAG TPA: hypothetical protein DCQ26_02480 [Marinilabiliales bacterium]|nr:MAG: hypothetical protein A2W95_16215 [Bacteroidetes bacterium GWA2_40_14]OFX60041.1 MAG: hypothetical protein A2W84_14565 [Bacteroidetes bacterium GWC2_40_13]OFX71499.1 MAG: hypothetical protein A2W96_03070 [Bacteroidetes bacterium GWD2_40_43]OFX89456.1 MAG: hypothetical protein A2W97_13965 [Bacteroidetes bacterium GWE2_40_63]OFY23282.1 MAG: hypothetical protein A2W88_19625 [Bacteroidetes bacterium GWF2_40_13]OFZ28109.1 MAG: hypothetical protein A2437_04370 [Bacteroidetes bacterium RIFOXYC